jgi:CRP-like cAMP-binding protein
MMLLNQPGISKPLKTTIALHLYKDLVNTVPFFAGSDSRFLGKVCLALETAVYLPGDTIIYCDDIGKEMFIVRKGLVEILVPDSENPEKRIYLRDGNFFGETALVIDVRRTNTVRAVNICDLNVLSKHAFNEIAAEYPEFGERMKRTVIKRQLDNMNIQSPAEKAKVHNQLTLVVEKSLKQRRMSVSLRTIYRAKKLGDKLKEIADRASKPVRRISRAVVPRQTRIRPSIREDFQRTSVHTIHAGDSTKDLAQFSGPQGISSARNLLQKRQTVHRKSSGLSRQLTHPGATDLSGSGRRTIDSVSRKLSRTELTLDLIPSALLDISTMVEQIRQTTELLSLRLGATEDLDDDEEDDDFDFDENYSDDLSLNLRESPAFPPLAEEPDEEMARRESNSIVRISTC